MPLTLIVVLDEQGRAEGTLYEDAGDGYEYLDNEFCLSLFKARKQGSDVIVECSEQAGNLSKQKHLATVVVIDEDGVRYGFGDICSRVTVMLNEDAEMMTEIDLLR